MYYFTIVIGAGAAGLVVAKGLAKAGKKVLLIEKGNFGGDCTNFGCIPSKTLIHLSHQMHTLGSYQCHKPLDKIFPQMQSIVEGVRSTEDEAALKKLGIDVVTGRAEFVDSHTLQVKGEKYAAKYIVIATGAKPKIPEIEGIENVPIYTNETIFSLARPPKSLIILGAGPIGSELAQAFARCDSKVFLINHSDHILSKESKVISQAMCHLFTQEGIDLFLDYTPFRIAYDQNQISLFIRNNKTKEEKKVIAETILVSVGRMPSFHELHLKRAGIKTNEKAILIDKYGRTNKKHIYAIGDVTGSPFFTHRCENQGRAVLSSLLLPWKKKFSLQLIPRVTYTDPEIASIGLVDDEQDKFTIYDIPLKNVDRAITQGSVEGMIRIVTKKWSSKIVGATIMAPRAGEMLMEISLAIQHKIPLRKLSSLIHPYPTYSLGIRQVADQWLTQTIIPLVKKK